MDEAVIGLKLVAQWKLEKYEGEYAPGSVPLETISGEFELTPQQTQEVLNGTDKRGA